MLRNRKDLPADILILMPYKFRSQRSSAFIISIIFRITALTGLLYFNIIEAQENDFRAEKGRME